MNFSGHIAASIRGLLNQSDEDLHHMLTGGDGQPLSATDAREILTAELEQGHLYIPADGCDNFDPKKGCLGHPGQGESSSS